MVLCMIDIETIPDQTPGALERYIQDAADNVKVPSGYTKALLGADLGMSEKEYKFISRDDLNALWIDRCGHDKAREVGEHTWRKTALDGSHGSLLSVAYIVGDGETKCLYRYPSDDEAGFLRSVFDSIQADLNTKSTPEAPSSALPFFVAHNSKFDLTFLFRRAVILGVAPPFRIPWDGRHPHDYFCTSQAWAGFGNRISQDSLCAILGLEQKPDGIDGSKVYDAYLAGEHDRIKAYNCYDTETVRTLYRRLNFMGAGE